MRVDVKLNGMDKVEDAMKHARACMEELDQAVSAVYAALNAVGVEIAQPLDEGNDRA